MDWETLILRGIERRQRDDASQWDWGDDALLIETQYGAHRLQEYAELVGKDYKTLLRYRWVASRYEKFQRRNNLSFTHHEAIAGREDRLQWLEAASSNNWSSRQLGVKVATYDREKKEKQRASSPLPPEEQTATPEEPDSISAVTPPVVEPAAEPTSSATLPPPLRDDIVTIDAILEHYGVEKTPLEAREIREPLSEQDAEAIHKQCIAFVLATDKYLGVLDRIREDDGFLKGLAADQVDLLFNDFRRLMERVLGICNILRPPQY
jgi:hypothetical protein